jgi:hypothetical protein
MILSTLALLTAVQAGGPTVHTPAEWREDLAHLVGQVRTKHPLPYRYGASEQEFSRAVDDLAAKLEHYSDGRIVLEIFRVFAMLDDSHSEPYWNTIRPELIDMRVVPLRFRHMTDGVHVTQSMTSHRRLLGAKLVEIEGRPVDEVLTTAMEYMSGDNDLRRRTVAIEVVLTRPGVLHALDLCESQDEVTCRLELPNGDDEVVRLGSLDGPSFPPPLENEASVSPRVGEWSKRRWEHVNDQSSLPLWQQDRGRRYWFEYLEDQRLLYMRFKRVMHDPAEDFDAFTDRLFEFIERHDVEKLVVDMRKNRGGYGNIGLRFVERISEHELGRKGRLFVIVGRGTKSAAPVFGLRLELEAEPIFVGERSGGRPTPFGRTFPITLPNSGVAVRCASLVFKLTPVPDPRKCFAPDLEVELSIDAFRSNRDPALQAVIDYGSRDDRPH